MTSLLIDSAHATAVAIALTDDTLSADLADGCTVSVPLEWYPRLLHATATERSNWRFIGGGQGVHWPDLDEDVSIENMVAGKASAESPRSLQRWLIGRSAQ